MSEEFDLSWLDLREPFDAFARSEALAAALLARLPARPRLIDLGAGTGSLLRWLAPRIGRAQAWTLVDSSAAMAEAAFDTIADRAELMGFPVTAPNKRTLLVHAPGGAWRIEALIADLAESPANLPLQAGRCGGQLRALRPGFPRLAGAHGGGAAHPLLRRALRRRTGGLHAAAPG